MVNEDTMLQTQMFPYLPASTTFVADTKFVSETKNVSDFFQKHFVPATNASRFVQHGNKTVVVFSACLPTQETSFATALARVSLHIQWSFPCNMM